MMKASERERESEGEVVPSHAFGLIYQKEYNTKGELKLNEERIEYCQIGLKLAKRNRYGKLTTYTNFAQGSSPSQMSRNVF